MGRRCRKCQLFTIGRLDFVILKKGTFPAFVTIFGGLSLFMASLFLKQVLVFYVFTKIMIFYYFCGYISFMIQRIWIKKRFKAKWNHVLYFSCCLSVDFFLKLQTTLDEVVILLQSWQMLPLEAANSVFTFLTFFCSHAAAAFSQNFQHLQISYTKFTRVT